MLRKHSTISRSSFDLELPERGDLLAEIPIFTKITPWERPRVGKAGNVYQPKTKQAEILRELELYDPLKIDVPVIIDSYIFFQRPGREDLFPIQRRFGDEDNLRKTINDCLVLMGILSDDSLVVGGENYKVFSTEDFAFVKIFEVKGAT